MSSPLSFAACKAPLTRVLDGFTEILPGTGEAARAPAGARGPLETWLELLVSWNARIDLTAARDEAELVDLMLADAAVLGSMIPEGARVVDVGTGAGAPGLALALLRPDLALTLVEPLGKRVSFLRTVLGSVRRSDVRLVHGRSEPVVRSGETWQVAISRATLPPPAWVETGAALVQPGGTVWALLARDEPPAAPAGLTQHETTTYTWPNTAALRHAVRYTKG